MFVIVLCKLDILDRKLLAENDWLMNFTAPKIFFNAAFVVMYVDRISLTLLSLDVTVPVENAWAKFFHIFSILMFDDANEIELVNDFGTVRREVRREFVVSDCDNDLNKLFIDFNMKLSATLCDGALLRP